MDKKHIMQKVIIVKLRFVFIASTVISLIISATLYIRTENAVEEYSGTVLKTTVRSRVNESVYEYISANADTFNNICSYKYTKNGTLSLITINSAEMNVLRVGIEKTIVAEIEKLNYESFEMPIGNISGIKILSGCGPKIKIKIVPLGTAECDTINDFTSVGINQTLHRVGLKFTVSFCGAPPFNGTAYKSEFYIAICENLITGEVPLVYS